jgi:acyl-coenzyme A synthetase/AMP-(fatty) acid ligase
VLQFASISFDAWVPDVVTSLSSGATLCIPSQEQLLPGGPLEDYMQKEHISAATLPPSVLATMVTDNLPYLRSVVSAGEACTRETAARWSRTRKFINGYGPTEATVCTSLAVSPDVSVAPVIGRPLQNLQVYIIDRYLNPQPIGVPGELCVAGVGVARGYLGRPELTAERFPATPFPGSGSERMYRTGDLVRYHPDGNIEYLGRIDQQVKLRGFRIELGEIEAAISSHPNVQHCAVVLREDVPGEKKLVAYIVPADSKPPALLELRDHLKERLPDYMVPSAFVLLDVLPLSPNGKVDKKALPPPAPSAHVGGDGYDPPRTDLERTVAAVYAEVLRLPAVGRNDNFFEIGGQSLIAMQVITRIRASLNVDLRVHHLFDHPSVASLAELLSELAPSREEKPVVPPEAPAIDVNALSDEEVERMLAELLRQQGGKP